MTIFTTGRATLLAAALALSFSMSASAEVKSHPVEGSAMTEALACRAANRTARIGLDADELISVSPCRCVQEREHHFVCTVVVTYERKD